MVAEVQSVGAGDGSATLHARSLRYGKLRDGVFLAVSGTGGGGGVVRSRRQQFTLDTSAGAQGGSEVDIILGVNGYVWLSKHFEARTGSTKKDGKTAGGVDLSISNLDEAVGAEAYSSQNEMIDEGTRREMSRLSEVIRCLAEGAVRVDEESVRRGYQVAVDLELSAEGARDVPPEMAGREILDMETRRRVVEGVLAG